MKPLFDAGMFFLSDLLSTLFFVGLYAVTHNVYLATGVGIALGLGQIAWELARRRPIDTMQWLSLGLVVVFGGATLITHNALFIKVKPALIYAAVGVVMLKPGWMTRYMPKVVIDTAPDIPRAFGYIWATMMFATAAATLVIAFRFDMRAYTLFLAVFPLPSKLVLFGVQYVTTRLLVVRRLKSRARGGAALNLA
jgi:intracellular septation protein A